MLVYDVVLILSSTLLILSELYIFSVFFFHFNNTVGNCVAMGINCGLIMDKIYYRFGIVREWEEFLDILYANSSHFHQCFLSLILIHSLTHSFMLQTQTHIHSVFPISLPTLCTWYFVLLIPPRNTQYPTDTHCLASVIELFLVSTIAMNFVCCWWCRCFLRNLCIYVGRSS